ncbi:hypothetical protein L2E76_05835 [Planktothrix agardhii 1811]|uniref:hypothetical protein n=1 Tax=Planktothrix agardhii TaxID=1160 RepID=UPI001F324820|nr:hypothetical protein [Planktothrix agardhii]MCF3580042.1 hypothetical protein [Planktothrix agardhii 1811]
MAAPLGGPWVSRAAAGALGIGLALGLAALAGPGSFLLALAGAGFVGFAAWLAAQGGLRGATGPSGHPHDDGPDGDGGAE